MVEITYPLKIEEKLWKDFKDKISKNQTINDVIVKLIEEVIKDEKNIFSSWFDDHSK